MKSVSLKLTLAWMALAMVAPACSGDDDDDDGTGGSSGTGGTAGSSGTPSGAGGDAGGAGGSPGFEIDCEALCENVIECAASAAMAGAGGAGGAGPSDVDPSECLSSCEFSVSILPTESCAAELAAFLACSATVEPDAMSCIDGVLRQELICTDEFEAAVACQGG